MCVSIPGAPAGEDSLELTHTVHTRTPSPAKSKPRIWTSLYVLAYGDPQWEAEEQPVLRRRSFPGRYHLAVTRHHAKEDTSSSLYTQHNPWEPPVSFENFLRNDEDLDNKDLVAWLTVGFLHVPHSEDVPNTATPGNAVGFYLRPFNFFDEDPSTASRRTVIVRPDSEGGVQVQRWTPSGLQSCYAGQPFSYNGTYGPE